MNKIIYKIGLVLSLLLVLCLFHMPYGYYHLVRFLAMVFFLCLAYTLYKEQNMQLSIVACSLALLFQPFIKIVLGRTIWNIVDILVAIALVIVWYKRR